MYYLFTCLRDSMAVFTNLAVSLLLLLAVACDRSTRADSGGAATGDDLESPRAGSAAANDSFLEKVPPGQAPGPVHDEAGRDTVES